MDDGTDFVMADCSGLIEGALQGVGLGIQFCCHVERTRVLCYLVEMDPENGREPLEDYDVIRKELGAYDENILKRPELIVLSKMDCSGLAERLLCFKAALVDRGIDPANIFEILSLTHRGVCSLSYKTATVLKTAPQSEPKQEPV